jgi:predicted outer membrane repeat protein
VYVDNNGNFAMDSGTISGNTAKNGGGVYWANNEGFRIVTGTITGNTARNQGGGVYFSQIRSYYGGLVMENDNGTITGYVSDSNNGNVVKDEKGNVQTNRGHAAFWRRQSHDGSVNEAIKDKTIIGEPDPTAARTLLVLIICIPLAILGIWAMSNSSSEGN